MYDSILLASGELAAGVTLASVLESCTEAAAAGILELLPTGALSAAALAPAGTPCSCQHLRTSTSLCQRCPGSSALLPDTRGLRAVMRLHQVLRDSVGMMAVGVEVRREDTVAEEAASAVTSMAGTSNAKDSSKQLGDVRRAPGPPATLHRQQLKRQLRPAQEA